MQIQISIPQWLLRAKDTFVDWANVPVLKRGRIELRRIDVMVTYGFVACVGWYYFTGGWKGALVGGVTYIFVAMVALWF
jgi:hypothetical protein